MTLAKSVMRGASWSAASRTGHLSLQFAVTVILARLLSPADFGVVAMATAVTSLVFIFGDLGTSAAVIQKQQHSSQFLSTVFWMNVAFGLLVMLVMMAMAPLAAAFFREPRLTIILMVLSVSFPLMGLVVLQKALLEKSMRFDVLAKIETISTAAGSGVAIGIAYSGGGVWSLVLQPVISATAMSSLLWIHSEWRPTLALRVSEIKSIGAFSANLTGFQLVNYVARNADNIIIGRFLGSRELGYYALAYRILMFPIQHLSSVIVRVTLPAFAQIQADDARFRRVYLRTIAAIGFITFPMMTFLFVVAKPLILDVFGEQWLSVVPVLLIFAPVGLVQSIVATVGAIYVVKGKTGLLFKWGVFSGSMAAVAFVVGLPWGIVGVAGCYALVSLVLAYPGMAIPLRLIGLTVRDCLIVLWRPLVCALVMAGCVWGIEKPLASISGGWRLLAADAVVGVVAYFILSLIANSAQVRVFRDLVKQPN
jgi:PST family polysaccharide transporter